MLYLKNFAFNAFQENTYLLYDDRGEAFIFDPGNSNATENQLLRNFITEKKLRLSRLLLTHAHLDHILGNRFVHDTYGLLPEVHMADLFFIDRLKETAHMYGVDAEESPRPVKHISDGDRISIGDYELHCIHTPGHSPGSISFYCPQAGILISGDVLFYGSIGRTDLPMGDHETLLSSIREKLFILPPETKVFSGHGPSTTIGFEKENNPFF